MKLITHECNYYMALFRLERELFIPLYLCTAFSYSGIINRVTLIKRKITEYKLKS